MIEPPCTEPYARWCERSATQLMGSLLLDCITFMLQIIIAENQKKFNMLIFESNYQQKIEKKLKYSIVVKYSSEF